MRICSLLPAATETLYALGLGSDLVAVSHECDYPPEATRKPRVTSAVVDPASMSSAEIDEVVAKALVEGRSTYTIDLALLRDLRPDLIITQDVCIVCAVGGSEVRRAAAQLDPAPRVLALDPGRVDDVLNDVRVVGAAAGASERAVSLARSLRERIDRVGAATADRPRQRVLCLEWLDPAWIAGHWMPEIVDLAGGADALGRAGEPSRRATWDEIAAAAPAVAIIMPCGFDVARTMEEIGVLETIPHVARIPAFRDDRVFVVDGSSYFNRPGPRIVDGIEILAKILHPEAFDASPDPSAARKIGWPVNSPSPTAVAEGG